MSQVTEASAGGQGRSNRRLLARLGRRELWRNLALIAPTIVIMLVFYVYPMANLLVRSFSDPEAAGYTLTNYQHLLEEPAYAKVMLNTFEISLTVTGITFLLGYPTAYLINSQPADRRNLMLIAVLIPFWTSILVRTYAWMVLLQRRGALNTLLVQFGLIQEPLELMYNRFGVLVGMVHILLPYMILPLYSVMQGIDMDLIKAAENLGANPLQSFARVFFPLSLPGVGAGLSLVFILAVGFFITPALMGGARETMIAQLIQRLISILLDWELGSALAFVLLAVVLIFFMLFNRLLGLDRLLGGGGSR